MCHSTIAIYCFLDDLLKAMDHQEDIQIRLMTRKSWRLPLLRCFISAATIRNLWTRLWKPRFFRALWVVRVSRGDVNRDGFACIWSLINWARLWKNLMWNRAMQLIRIRLRCVRTFALSEIGWPKVADKENYRGYISSKREYFFGVRVQVITTIDNLPVEFSILPGEVPMFRLGGIAAWFSGSSEIAADAAYTEYEWEDHLQADDIKLLVMRKKNSHRGVICRQNTTSFGFDIELKRRLEKSLNCFRKRFMRQIWMDLSSKYLCFYGLFN